MAIVQPKSVNYRVWATHLVMWAFLALIIFPVIMVIAISFRNGNFSVGEIIPSDPTLDHWKLALGMSITNADGSITPPPFPVLTWLWNSIKIAGITALMIVTLSTTCAYAFARLRFRGKQTILQGMLIFQMFPAVLALVAIYALFNKIGDYVPWLGLNTHGGLILAS
ncbi:maltose ABC transporter permease MalG, partial [Serratia grimesii]|uniref:maltose ABC transporter permease MalG n=1 Tax=Serratia grimesii TaxID=82995 RepID=UPI00223FC4EA